MKYFAIISLFVISSCSYIESFNNWADSVMPTQEDFKDSNNEVYEPTQNQTRGNANAPYYTQDSNNYQQQQPPLGYDQQTTSPQPYQPQGYTQPQPYQPQGYEQPQQYYAPQSANDNSGEYKSMFDQSDPYGGGYEGRDTMIPPPPPGY